MTAVYQGFKPPQLGLVDTGDTSFYSPLPKTNNYPNASPKPIRSGVPSFTLSDLAGVPAQFSEMVLNVTWSRLQPTAGSFVTSAIDHAIAKVRRYNESNPTLPPLGLKLRVWGGYAAPDWTKNLGGPPILVTGRRTESAFNNNSQTIGRFWTADYMAAWADLQALLASKYDTPNSLIRGISNTAGMSSTDEPFVPGLYNPPAIPATNPPAPHIVLNQPAMLQAGGATDAAKRLTLRASIASYTGWSTTPLDFTFNAFFQQDTGQPVIDENFTLAVLQQARNSTRMVQAGNHALFPNSLSSSGAFLYFQMFADAALDPAAVPGSYQTATPYNLLNVGNDPTWFNTVAEGVAANAGNIELWNIPTEAVPTPPPNRPAPPQGETGFPYNPSLDVPELARTLAAGVAPTTGSPADGSALAFIAPGLVTGPAATIAFTGVDALLLASTGSPDSYQVTLTSLGTGTLSVTDPLGIVPGPTSGPTITLQGELGQVNTVLARLTDTLPTGIASDLVQVVATDLNTGNSVTRIIGVAGSSPGTPRLAGTPVAGAGAAVALGAIEAQLAASKLLVVGGVQASATFSGDLYIGADGEIATMLAALAPSAYSTASLTIENALDVAAGGTAFFSGLLNAASMTIDSGGAVVGTGTLSVADGSAIRNEGTIAAVSDLTLGLQRLTVANALDGAGSLVIGPGATLILERAVGPDQHIEFAPSTLAQLANDPISPSTLVLQAPEAMQAAISGFSFVDRLVLEGGTAGSVDYDSGAGKLTVIDWSIGAAPPINLAFDLSGDFSGPARLSRGNTISFKRQSQIVAAPKTLQGDTALPVPVPDIVLRTSSAAASHSVTLTAQLAPLKRRQTPPPGGALTVTAVGGAKITAGASGSSTVTLCAPTIAALERSLQTLTYTATGGTGEHIKIALDGRKSTSIAVDVGSPGSFTWDPQGGSTLFTDASNWATSAGSPSTPPGGGNDAVFAGPDTNRVTGDGAVGGIQVTGTTTMTGQVTAQSTVIGYDGNGALTLAGGASLSTTGEVSVGDTGDGLLTVMGALSAGSLVIGASGVAGTVVNLEQITVAGPVAVGQAGTGTATLALLGVASSLRDTDASIGPGAAVTVNGGQWINGYITGVTSGSPSTSSGQLTIDRGTLSINGMADGITGQVTAFNALVDGDAANKGSIVLDGGELLVANAYSSFNTANPANSLTVGASGQGFLSLENGSEVAVGLPTSSTEGTGTLDVATGGGSGHIVVVGNSDLMVYGSTALGVVGSGADTASVIVGLSDGDFALFAVLDTLTINGTGHLYLGSDSATVRASTVDIEESGVLSGEGTLSGLGGGNGTVTFTAIVNDGRLIASGGNLLIYGSIVGGAKHGTLAIDPGASLTLQSAVDDSQTLEFGADARAVLNDPYSFYGTITGFDAGNVLDLAGVQATGASWANDVLTIDVAGGHLPLTVVGPYASSSFVVQSDGRGGSEITLATL
jgi:hypothetical protein